MSDEDEFKDYPKNKKFLEEAIQELKDEREKHIAAAGEIDRKIEESEKMLEAYNPYWKANNAPHELSRYIYLIGQYLEKLPFEVLPQRITFGRVQYKLVSRESKMLYKEPPEEHKRDIFDDES